MAQEKLSVPRAGRHRLVVLLLVVAVCGGPMLVPVWRVWRQSRAIREIQALKGRMSYAYDVQEVLPEWTRKIIPRTVQCVDLRGTVATNKDIRWLADLHGLKQLDLTGTKVGSGGLSPLTWMAELEKLHLDRTMVTDDDLTALAGLQALRELTLANTGITAAGIKNLGPQPSLVRLNLSGTRVRDADIGSLAAFAHLQDLCLSQAQITAVSGAQLKSLSKLANICVKVDAGNGKAARGMLNQCGVRAVGRGGVTETRLWDSLSPWGDTLAGTIETIERYSRWPSQRSDELVRAYCRALADHEFPRPDPSAAAAPLIPVSAPATSAARALTCAEFLELARKSLKQDRPSLESFAKSTLSRDAVAELIGALNTFSAVPSDGPLEEWQSNQLRWITNAIVQQGLGDDRTVSALMRLLKSSNSSVKAIAIYSLNPSERRRMLNDPDWKPDKTYSAAVVKLLSAIVDDTGWEVQSATASAMSRAVETDSTQAKIVMPLLVSMLGSPDPHSTPQVLSAIRRTSDADFAASRDAVPELIRMCQAAKSREKVIFAEALCHVACKNADDTRTAALPLMQLLSYADLPRRSTACRFLRSAAERQPASLDVILPVVVKMFDESTVADGSPAGDALAAIADGVHARANPGK